MNLNELVTALQQTYARQPDLCALLDASVVDTLELSTLERKVLLSLLVAGGDRNRWVELIPDVKPPALAATVGSLVTRGLLREGDTGDPIDLTLVWQQLRAQQPHEAARDEDETTQDASTKLVLRPMRERVLLLARAGDTATRGLARVYAFLYGGVFTSKTFGMLGLYAKELGREQAALFLLEHCHAQYRDPLKELLPLARARAKGFRPVDAPDEGEVRRGKQALQAEALAKRLAYWERLRREGKDPAAIGGAQYSADMRAAKRRYVDG